MFTRSEIPDLSDTYNRLSRLAISLSQLAGVTSASALAVGSGRGQGTTYSVRGKGIGRGTADRGRFQCTYCGKMGHLEDRCWNKHGRPSSMSQGRGMVTKQGKSLTLLPMGFAQVATPMVESSLSSTVPETVIVGIDRVEYEEFLAHKAS
uniref:CCHC-type domain-containing protein n=1 Tax=Nymphaea colorata TaxID=210225 RepID=A0A5K1AQF5_9MAGN